MAIKERLDELHRLWELLLTKLSEKGMRLQEALILVQFLRQCDEVLFWINDKEAFVTAEEFGSDLEHVEVLQRKFDEFQKDMTSQEFRITEVSDTAEKIISQRHPESDTVAAKRKEVLEAWARLKSLASSRQGKDRDEQITIRSKHIFNLLIELFLFQKNYLEHTKFNALIAMLTKQLHG